MSVHIISEPFIVPITRMTNGCLGILLNILGKKPAPDAAWLYSLTDRFLSPAERSFLGVLDQAVSGRYRVFAKVRLADVFQVDSKKENWRGAFNKIASKHVDFLLCDPSTVQPVCAIELDDGSHSRRSAIKGDAFKDAVFSASGIRLLRIKARRSYSVADLESLLFPIPPLPPAMNMAESS